MGLPNFSDRFHPRRAENTMPDQDSQFDDFDDFEDLNGDEEPFPTEDDWDEADKQALGELLGGGLPTGGFDRSGGQEPLSDTSAAPVSADSGEKTDLRRSFAALFKAVSDRFGGKKSAAQPVPPPPYENAGDGETWEPPYDDGDAAWDDAAYRTADVAEDFPSEDAFDSEWNEETDFGEADFGETHFEDSGGYAPTEDIPQEPSVQWSEELPPSTENTGRTRALQARAKALLGSLGGMLHRPVKEPADTVSDHVPYDDDGADGSAPYFTPAEDNGNRPPATMEEPEESVPPMSMRDDNGWNAAPSAYEREPGGETSRSHIGRFFAAVYAGFVRFRRRLPSFRPKEYVVPESTYEPEQDGIQAPRLASDIEKIIEKQSELGEVAREYEEMRRYIRSVSTDVSSARREVTPPENIGEVRQAESELFAMIDEIDRQNRQQRSRIGVYAAPPEEDPYNYRGINDDRMNNADLEASSFDMQPRISFESEQRVDPNRRYLEQQYHALSDEQTDTGSARRFHPARFSADRAFSPVSDGGAVPYAEAENDRAARREGFPVRERTTNGRDGGSDGSRGHVPDGKNTPPTRSRFARRGRH